jgi:hypothetical protein
VGRRRASRSAATAGADGGGGINYGVVAGDASGGTRIASAGALPVASGAPDGGTKGKGKSKIKFVVSSDPGPAGAHASNGTRAGSSSGSAASRATSAAGYNYNACSSNSTVMCADHLR